MRPGKHIIIGAFYSQNKFMYFTCATSSLFTIWLLFYFMVCKQYCILIYRHFSSLFTKYNVNVEMAFIIHIEEV